MIKESIQAEYRPILKNQQETTMYDCVLYQIIDAFVEDCQSDIKFDAVQELHDIKSI
jgi:hypothetical protein